MQGKIILLNGASNSGKSTLARALQAQLPEPYWNVSIDHLWAAEMLPSIRIKSGEFPWSGLRPSFFEGFHRCLPALAGSGNNLIVEYVLETAGQLRSLLENLGHLDVFIVGVHCPLEELERREAARGDRPLGDARRDFGITHSFCEYDFEVLATRPTGETVRELMEAWTARGSPAAFARMLLRAGESRDAAAATES